MSQEQFLTQIGNALSDSPDNWTENHVQLYQSLEKILIKTRRHYLQAQFRMDLEDIKENVTKQQWFCQATPPQQEAITNFMNQMRIMSFNLTRHESTLRMNLTISLENSNLKLQYFNSSQKFLYYLYFEKISDPTQRAYLAKNHPKFDSIQNEQSDNQQQDQDQVPQLKLLYKHFFEKTLRKIPAGLMMKIMAEIILFYEETETILKTPISQQTEWSLASA